jgi:hypothetical protein
MKKKAEDLKHLEPQRQIFQTEVFKVHTVATGGDTDDRQSLAE